jgi:hypothetical protein
MLEPSLLGGVGAMGHVTTLEPSPGGWCTMCLGARGIARALWHRELVWSHKETRWHQSPPLSGAESGAVWLDLSLMHGGTQSVEYRQWPPSPPWERR